MLNVAAVCDGSVNCQSEHLKSKYTKTIHSHMRDFILSPQTEHGMRFSSLWSNQCKLWWSLSVCTTRAEQSNDSFCTTCVCTRAEWGFLREGGFLTRRVYGAPGLPLGQNCRIQPLLFAHFREIKTGLIRLNHHLFRFTSPHH